MSAVATSSIAARMLLWIVKKLKKLPALNAGSVAFSVANW
jgi:hypothetical protein